MIPRAPLLLGLAGLLPFIWGALSTIVPSFAELGSNLIGPRFVGPYLTVFYGAIILSFMSGVIWGFATRGESPLLYGLSVLPALWAFFFTGGGAGRAAGFLIFGFIALLAIDALAARKGLAPPWWMNLRLGLTAIVVLSLSTALGT